jgi:hypothetical protein
MENLSNLFLGVVALVQTFNLFLATRLSQQVDKLSDIVTNHILDNKRHH